AVDAVPRAQAPEEPELRDLRSAPDGHAAHRLRGVLRRGGGIVWGRGGIVRAHGCERGLRRGAQGDARPRRVLRARPRPRSVAVREPREWAISDLSDSVKIPLGTLPQSLDKLTKEDEIVVYCRTGARSGNAVQFLQRMGFAKAKNLVGGINLWAERIDPSLAKY